MKRYEAQVLKLSAARRIQSNNRLQRTALRAAAEPERLVASLTPRPPSPTLRERDRVRLIVDPEYRGHVAGQLQARLNQRSLNAAFRAYAEAMNSAQLLETGLALLILNVRHERSSERTADELFQLYGYEFRQPLGRLIRILNTEIQVSTAARQDLATALELRNLLAHRYFRERMTDWLLPSGLKRIREELGQIQAKIEAASRQVDTLETQLCRKAQVEKKVVLNKLESEILPLLLRVYDRHDGIRSRKPPRRTKRRVLAT